MKYQLKYTRQFRKSLKLCKKRGLDFTILEDILNKLQNGEMLPLENKAHKLTGNYRNCWECHIQADWLLIWQQYEKELVLIMLDTGTHSDLFK